MNKAQRIKALERALAAIEVGISRVEAALPAASTMADVKRLNAQLASLKSERFNLGMQLENLRASEARIDPLGDADAARLKEVSDALDAAIVDRAVVVATIDFVNDVLANARELKDRLA